MALKLAAQLITGQKNKATPDEIDDLVTALLDDFPNLEEDEIEQLEENPRRMARMIFEKRMKPKIPLQAAAQEYLMSKDKPLVVKRAPVIPSELYLETPYENIFGVFPSPDVISVAKPDGFSTIHQINVHETVFNTLMEEHTDELNDIVVELRDREGNFHYKRVVGVTSPGSPMNHIESKDLSGRFFVKFIKGLVVVQKMTFWANPGAKSLPDSSRRMLLEAYMRGMPAIHINQRLILNEKVQFSVVSLEPNVAFAKLPFDGQVAYEFTENAPVRAHIPDLFHFRGISREHLFSRYSEPMAHLAEHFATEMDLAYAPESWIKEHNLREKIHQRDNPRCVVCDEKNPRMFRCGHCISTVYCGAKCQEIDAINHL